MMSAASMSAMIRAKKKKMEEDKDFVDLSGQSEDATDIQVMDQKAQAEELSENMPKEHSDEPSDDDKQKLAKTQKMRAMMMKMSK